MNPLNLATTSSPPPVANDLLAKRKRRRPRKDETTTQPQQENVNLVGKTFSAVVAGSFDTGHIVNVKVNDSDTELIGFVFRKGKVTPVAPENDVAPHVKMVAKEGIKNQTDLPPNDQPVKDVEICESARPLSLVPYQSDDEEPKEAVVEERDGVIVGHELCNPSSGPAIINKHLFSYSLRVISIRFKLSTRTSPNPTDESSSRSFTSLLTVLGSNSWRPLWGMKKYLRGRLNWSPFFRHLTDESSLDRRVVTRPTSPHSTVLSSLGAERSLSVARLDLRNRLAQSLAKQGLAEAYPYLTYPSWLDDESSRKQLARALAVTRIDLSRSLGADRYRAVTWLDLSRRHSTNESSLDRRVITRSRSRHSTDAYPYLTYPSWLHDESSRKQLARALAVTRLDLSRSLGADRSRAVAWLDLSRSLARSLYSAQIDLSQSLRYLSPRGVDVSIQQQGLAEEYPYLTTISRSCSDLSLLAELTCRSVVTRSTSRHSTDEFSLDRRVLTRPTSSHSTDEFSLDRRVLTRPTSSHSTDEFSLDRRVITRSTSRHSTVLSSLDRRVITRPFSRHSTDESSLDRRVITRSTSRHSTDESSLDRFVVTRPFCRHSIDESSLDRRVLTRPTSRHSTDESSLDRRVVTRPTSPHSTDDSSLDRFVVTRPFCRHSAQSVLSPRSTQSPGSISRGHSTRSIAVT
uniref:Uncharacterized protein n=1 Tax=Brassica oleracea var. oleracea TaxID=109376 RepID=A0A0D3A500_BRAOL